MMMERLSALGFDCIPLNYGDVSNFWAERGANGPILVFAGHTDVVPTGPESQWHFPPFEPSIRDGVLFNVIPFSDNALPMEEVLIEMDDTLREDAFLFVEGLRAAGGTNVYEGLAAAFEDEVVDTIYLLTDGDPSAGAITDSTELREEVARWNSTRGIRIHSISVGKASALLKGLSEDSGGEYVEVK